MGRIAVPATSDARDGRRFIMDLDRRLERLDRSILVADWNLFTGRSRRGSDAWQLKRSALLSDPQILAWTSAARHRRWSFPFGRRLELLERVLLDAQVEQHPEVVRLRGDLQRRIVSYRPIWKGKRVSRAVVFKALWESPSSSERRRAYYAYETLHRPLERRLAELIRLRNERAQALGFRTFAEMRLGFQGITPARLEELCQAVAGPASEQVRAVRARFLARSARSGWHPWDFSFARRLRVLLPARSFPRRGMLHRTLDAVRQWGFRTDRMHFRVVEHDSPTGGMTLAPDPPRDVRILVHPQGGWVAQMVMFHEVGHAVHSSLIRAPRHLLRWHENVPGFGGFHEGVGALFEGIAANADWLSAQPGVGARRAREFAESDRAGDLLDAGWHASWLRVEQKLYERPDGDPIAESRRLEQRVFGYDDFAPLSFVDAFFVDSPVYVPNYLFATLFGRQLARALIDQFGEPLWPNRRVGPWLTREWFAPGSLYDWVPRLRAMTGRPFGAEGIRGSPSSG